MSAGCADLAGTQGVRGTGHRGSVRRASGIAARCWPDGCSPPRTRPQRPCAGQGHGGHRRPTVHARPAGDGGGRQPPHPVSTAAGQPGRGRLSRRGCPPPGVPPQPADTVAVSAVVPALQRRNVERLGVVAVHQVTGPAQPDEVLQPHATTIPQRQAPPVSAQWRPGCSKAQNAEDTPRRLRAARSEDCRGLASRIDARAPDRPPEVLTGRLKRSITAAMNITIYGWSTSRGAGRAWPE
jgi:hypothetical protein